MILKLLDPPSLASTLIEIAELSPPAFNRLLEEISSPKSFDADLNRLIPLSNDINLSINALHYIFVSLSYLYDQIHQISFSENSLEKAILNLLPSIIDEEEKQKEEKISARLKQIIAERLSVLLQKRPNATSFASYERLRWGFLPTAIEFSSNVDLRPNMSNDLTNIDELIPLIQFKIVTSSATEKLKNLVFQVDAKGLRQLREAIDLAELKLANIQANEAISHLISMRSKQL